MATSTITRSITIKNARQCKALVYAFERAKKWIQKAEIIIDAGVEIGECNRRMQELITLAKQSGKLKRG